MALQILWVGLCTEGSLNGWVGASFWLDGLGSEIDPGVVVTLAPLC